MTRKIKNKNNKYLVEINNNNGKGKSSQTNDKMNLKTIFLWRRAATMIM